MAKIDTLKTEYTREELGQGIRGKYYQRYQEGTNVVVLSPDVAAFFPTEELVNSALRSLIASTNLTTPTANVHRD
jgi:hypothetical protein